MRHPVGSMVMATIAGGEPFRAEVESHGSKNDSSIIFFTNGSWAYADSCTPAPRRFLITETDGDEPGFWSNAHGWTSQDEADRFTEEERDTLRLPNGGHWIEEVDRAYADSCTPSPLDPLVEARQKWDDWARIANHRLGEINRLHAALNAVADDLDETAGLSHEAVPQHVLLDAAEALRQARKDYVHIPPNMPDRDEG